MELLCEIFSQRLFEEWTSAFGRACSTGRRSIGSRNVILELESCSLKQSTDIYRMTALSFPTDCGNQFLGREAQ